MKLLLDTHVWLWWNTDPERLATIARRQISDARNEVFLSAASVWEMAIKRRLGKLHLPESVGSYVARRLSGDDIRSLPVNTWLTKSFIGMRAMLFKLGARVPFGRIIREETSVPLPEGPAAR